MASRLRLNSLAFEDLEGIFLYTARRWSVSQADRYILNLEEGMALLADNPDQGRSIDDIREGYLSRVIASHLIVYRKTEDGIEVMRVLHRRMDVRRHL